ncbi:MAG: hypothetical protein HZB76_06840 [Chlamydiae bacterium]|nr:hypothetical protein [Chlamydiota bacterium]
MAILTISLESNFATNNKIQAIQFGEESFALSRLTQSAIANLQEQIHDLASMYKLRNPTQLIYYNDRIEIVAAFDEKHTIFLTDKSNFHSSKKFLKAASEIRQFIDFKSETLLDKERLYEEIALNGLATQRKVIKEKFKTLNDRAEKIIPWSDIFAVIRNGLNMIPGVAPIIAVARALQGELFFYPQGEYWQTDATNYDNENKACAFHKGNMDIIYKLKKISGFFSKIEGSLWVILGISMLIALHFLALNPVCFWLTFVLYNVIFPIGYFNMIAYSLIGWSNIRKFREGLLEIQNLKIDDEEKRKLSLSYIRKFVKVSNLHQETLQHEPNLKEGDVDSEKEYVNKVQRKILYFEKIVGKDWARDAILNIDDFINKLDKVEESKLFIQDILKASEAQKREFKFTIGLAIIGLVASLVSNAPAIAAAAHVGKGILSQINIISNYEDSISWMFINMLFLFLDKASLYDRFFTHPHPEEKEKPKTRKPTVESDLTAPLIA